MTWIWRLRVLTLMTIAPLAVVSMARAASAEPWTVAGKLDGKSKKDGVQVATDISGLACAPATTGTDRLCLIVDDESQGTQVVILGDARLLAGDPVPLSHEMFGSKPLELDAEGVAYARDYFYVVGSHGRPRREGDKSEAEIAARTKATRHLYRIDLSKAGVHPETGKLDTTATVVESVSLDPFIKADSRLADSDRPLDENGLTIEGLAVKGENLTLGFRGPSVDGSGIVLDIPLPALFDAKPGVGKAKTLALGKDASGKARGIRDLVAIADGFVGIAGPVTDPPKDTDAIKRGDFALFLWDGSAAPVLRELDGYGAQTKPEAILPLKLDAGKLRALLLFDGPLNGKPTEVETDFSSN